MDTLRELANFIETNGGEWAIKCYMDSLPALPIQTDPGLKLVSEAVARYITDDGDMMRRQIQDVVTISYYTNVAFIEHKKLHGYYLVMKESPYFRYVLDFGNEITQ